MPKELRHTPFVSYLEPTLYALVQQAMRSDDITGSAYVRNLIIKDLRARGILTENIMVGILEGTNLDKALEVLTASQIQVTNANQAS